MSRRLFLSLAAVAYVAAGLAAFAPILHVGFLADDWIFLSLAAPAHSPLVCFVPLVGRFIRPMVMLTYYLNYHAFGLWTVPYHVTLLLVHVVNAWLVSLLALRLSGSRLVAFGSGLIFLLFAGHSEAVSWVAGAADPWLVFFLLPGLLLFARGLEAERRLVPLAGACLAFAGALLGKESAVIAPALVCAWGACALLTAGSPDERRRIAARTAIVAAALAGVAAVYLLMRARVFDSAFGAYSDLNANRAIMIGQARAFVLRSFFPPGRALAAIWFHGYDRVLFAGGLLGFGLLLWRAPPARRGLLFLVAALAIALAPVVPLSISLSHSTSERFVYVPTVFSSILIAWAVTLVCGRRRIAAAVLLAAIAALQLPALARSNRAWVDASTLFGTFMDDAVRTLRAEAPTRRSRLFVLTLPDNLRGTVVIRSAFHPALTLLAPEIEHPEARAVFVASHDMETPHDVTSLTRDGDRRFTVQLSAGRFLEQQGGDTPDFSFEAWSPTGYVLVFKPLARRTVVAYTNRGRLETAAILNGVPFGSLDIPADNTACTGDTLRFSGWALDDEESVEVILEKEAGPGAWTRLGTADRRTGTRPDVSGAYREFPSADRAEWNYLLPCKAVQSTPAPMRVRAVARDRAGQQMELGTRTVRAK